MYTRIHTHTHTHPPTRIYIYTRWLSGKESAVLGTIPWRHKRYGFGSCVREDPLEGNPLQYSYLENPMDRGAWQAVVHRVIQSWT